MLQPVGLGELWPLHLECPGGGQELRGRAQCVGKILELLGGHVHEGVGVLDVGCPPYLALHLELVPLLLPPAEPPLDLPLQLVLLLLPPAEPPLDPRLRFVPLLLTRGF